MPLSHPWILARLITGLVAVALATAAAVGAARIFLHYHADAPPDERTLALERQSELVATTLTLAFTVQLFAALLTVLTADRLAGSLRGAMCAYGVLHSHRWGTAALLSSLAAAAGCTAWLATRRVDIRLRRGSLVRTLAGLALGVTGLSYIDLFVNSRFFLGLDFDIVASCCSVFVDSPANSTNGDAKSRTIELIAAGFGTVAALVTGAMLARRPTGRRGVVAGAMGLGGGYIALRAVIDVVAPYAYESPYHRCPYCLLHLDVGIAGPILLGALSVGVLSSVAALAVVPLLNRPGARAAALQVLARIGWIQSGSWAVAIVTGAWPMVRYAMVTGTFQLFR